MADPTSHLIHALEKIQNLDEATITYMVSLCHATNFPKKSFLLQPGEKADKLYFIAQGLVMQRYLEAETGKAVSFHFEGDFVTSFESFLNNSPSEYCLQTLEDSTLLYWTLADYNFFLGTHPNAKLASLSFTQELFYREFKSKSRLISYTPEKLYRFILEKEPQLIQRVPLLYIAEYMGISNEHLSRIRKKIR